MKALAYLRVSTIGQAAEDKFGLKEQRDLIEGYAKENGYDIIEWYTDGGISGVKEERPAMNTLLYGDTPPVDAVIIAKSDRLARDIKLYYYYLMLLEKKGIKLISATEPVVNDETGLGNIYRALMLFVAEQERKNIFIRTSLAKKKKRLQGGYVGGRVPYGYFVYNHELHIEPAEERIVKEIFAMRERGRSMPAIQTALYEKGMKTRVGTIFSPATIKRILDGELFYRGYMTVEGTVIKGRHTPILYDEPTELPKSRAAEEKAEDGTGFESLVKAEDLL